MSEDYNTFSIDWDVPGLTLWTRQASIVFEADFLLEYEMGSFPALRQIPQAGKIATLFMQYVTYLKKIRRQLANPKTAPNSRNTNRSLRRRVQVSLDGNSIYVYVNFLLSDSYSILAKHGF
jgi:hypothetical protein